MVDGISKEAKITEIPLTLRPFHENDLPGLCDLYARVWGTRLDDAYWRWKYITPPFKTLANVVEAPDGEIVAFTGIWVRRIRGKGEIYSSYQVVDVMADPEYRGGVAFGWIMDIIIDLMVKQKVILYGFTNDVSQVFFRKKLGKYILLDIDRPLMSLILNPGKLIPAPEKIRAAAGFVTKGIINARRAFVSTTGISVEQTNKVPDGIEQLWNTVKDDYPFRLIPDPDYLRWRFQSARDDYQIWVARENNRLAGYLVTSLKKRNDKIKGYLVDWIFPFDAPHIFKVLMKPALHWFLQNDTNVVETLLINDQDPVLNVLTSFFFIRGRRSKTFLLGCADPAMYQMDNISPRDLFIGRGDSDFSTLYSS
nr:GNAT family N-acetyltransferase [uncultured Desulfobacter sp.]